MQIVVQEIGYKIPIDSLPPLVEWNIENKIEPNKKEISHESI